MGLIELDYGSRKALRKLNKESRPRAGRWRCCTGARRRGETSNTLRSRPSPQTYNNSKQATRNPPPPPVLYKDRAQARYATSRAPHLSLILSLPPSPATPPLSSALAPNTSTLSLHGHVRAPTHHEQQPQWRHTTTTCRRAACATRDTPGGTWHPTRTGRAAQCCSVGNGVCPPRAPRSRPVRTQPGVRAW